MKEDQQVRSIIFFTRKQGWEQKQMPMKNYKSQKVKNSEKWNYRGFNDNIWVADLAEMGSLSSKN